MKKSKTNMEEGKQNELDIIRYLNNKKFKDLSVLWQENLEKMFKGIKKRDTIHSMFYYDASAKPDIVIDVKDKRVNLSIKTGRNPSVHEEHVEKFLRFLKSINISDKTIATIKFYHYGKYGDFDNHGKPFTREEMIEKFPNAIKRANKELNEPVTLRKIIKHCVIEGARPRADAIDYMWYGLIDEGYLLSSEEIYEMIIKDNSDEHRAIHFGGLIYQPSCRQLDNWRINYCKIKWPILCVKFYKRDII